MKVKALIGFSGLNICMSVGEEQDITDDALLEDLLGAGFVEPAQQILKDNGIVEEIKPINNVSINEETITGETTTGDTITEKTVTGETVTEEPTTGESAIVYPGIALTTTEESSTAMPTAASKKKKSTEQEGE